MAGTINRLREILAYQNAFVRVYDDNVQFSNGTQGKYLRITPNFDGLGVVIVAQYNNLYALVRTYRYPIGAHQWGFPRGFSHGKDIDRTVRIELLEELGSTADTVEILGHVTPDSGLLGSRVAIALVRVTTNETRPEDPDEIEDVDWLTYEKLSHRLQTGAIEDSFTLSAWALLTLKKEH
jgi:8-oxo-dGTP pyrophosphatase MutT (NUDIX family)